MRRMKARISALLDELVQDPGVAGGEIWIALDPAGQPVSMEEKLRGGDKKIKGALMIDTLRQTRRRTRRRAIVEQVSRRR